MADFQIVLGELLGLPDHLVSMMMYAGVDTWYILDSTLQDKFGTTEPGTYKYDRWWWKIHNERDEVEHKTKISLLECAQ